jgi:hypothetical protein
MEERRFQRRLARGNRSGFQPRAGFLAAASKYDHEGWGL